MMPIYKITVVGLGALGSHLILLARNWGASWTVIDFDRVESKNIQSQFHSRQGMGKHKVAALKAAMQGLFGLQMIGHTVKLGTTNRDHMLKGADLIIDCTDNFEARDIIQTAAAAFDIPCLHGCLSADGTFARVIWSELFDPDEENTEGEATCEDGRNLPFHSQAAALIAQVAQKFLETGKKESYQLTPFGVIRIA